MIDLNGKRVMVYPGPTDFRYGINGLSLLVGKRASSTRSAANRASRSSSSRPRRDRSWEIHERARRGALHLPLRRKGPDGQQPRVVKPFVIDGKNFLFSKAKAGAEASATMMTAIRTALRNGLIPERYLAWLFENSAKLSVERLMPWSDDVPASCKALGK